MRIYILILVSKIEKQNEKNFGTCCILPSGFRLADFFFMFSFGGNRRHETWGFHRSKPWGFRPEIAISSRYCLWQRMFMADTIWWFGNMTFIYHIWDVILPINELRFFKMVIAPPTSNIFILHLSINQVTCC